MRYSGIDEAGLGPLLGPYCAGLASLKYDCRNETLWQICQEAGIPVDDSKKLYSKGKIHLLEEAVLSFSTLFFSTTINSVADWLSLVLKEKKESLIDLFPDSPWWINVLNQSLPLQAKGKDIENKIESISKSFDLERIQIIDLSLTIVPAAQFNELLSQYKNKAKCCQVILSPLLQKALSESDHLLVDRQGGRRFYGEWLIDEFPKSALRIIREGKDSSRYSMGEKTIEFRVKGDATCFEAALASMFAKYARELFMIGFNQYWKAKNPNLKETAGYHTDGLRFLKDLESAHMLPHNMNQLKRNK